MHYEFFFETNTDSHETPFTAFDEIIDNFYELVD